MDQDLLRYLLETFPQDAPAPGADTEDHLLIHGYRVPFEAPVDPVMLGIMAEFRRSGFRSAA